MPEPRNETSTIRDEDEGSSLYLSVLGYREDGEWVALALEMDLRGYGITFREALEDLRELVLMQISFAYHKGQPGMIVKPAERPWWEQPVLL